MLDENNTAKVSDFAFTRFREEAQASGVASAMAWMAPEALRGECIFTLISTVLFLMVICYKLKSRRLQFWGHFMGTYDEPNSVV